VESGEWGVEHKVRPTLIVGVGEWGAQVAAAFARRMDRRAGQLPVVRAVALDSEGGEETGFFPKNPVSTELEQIRRLDAVQATRRAGWGVEGRAGSEVVLVASLGDDGTGEVVSQVARWLHALSERDFAHRLGLSAILLLPRDAEDGAEITRREEDPSSALGVNYGLNSSPEEALPFQHGGSECIGKCSGGPASAGVSRLKPGLHPAFSIVSSAPCDDCDSTNAVCTRRRMTTDDLLLFDEGCYLLNEVNADGLLLPTGEEQAHRVAHWLALRVLTGLRAALERLPLNVSTNEAHVCFDTFGLAAWEFPVEPLKEHLARRWQSEALQRLLAPSEDDPTGAVVAFLERHGQARSPWPQEALIRFRVVGDAWSAPALRLVHTLRREIDRAVEAEGKRLRGLIVQAEQSLDRVCAELQAALAAEVDALLDDHGLGTADGFLAALEDEARLRITQSEQEAERCSVRLKELDGPADQAGRVLDDLTGHFPPSQWRTVLGLVLRPWRLLRLWLLYREIGRRAGVYLAYRQSQWLLRAEAVERQWQAAFYARLAQAASEDEEAIAQLRARLERFQVQLASAPLLQQGLAQWLEAAALPVGLSDYFYRQVVGDGEARPAGLLALYGPLSRWVREGWEDETLSLILKEHAWEQFAFLDEVRLDDLLARTYSGAELRRRLAALVDAAAPWWACDEAGLDSGERACLRRLVLVGLPDADRSLLVDLLPDRPHTCFSTGDRHQVVVAQVMQGVGRSVNYVPR